MLLEIFHLPCYFLEEWNLVWSNNESQNFEFFKEISVVKDSANRNPKFFSFLPDLQQKNFKLIIILFEE